MGDFFEMTGAEVEAAAANAVDARFLRRYALLLLHGHRGLAYDVVRGLAVLERAADLGDRAAALRLGNAHTRGEHGVERNAELGMAFYRRAAELGCPAAQANVAAALLETSPAEATVWLERAARQGQPFACTMLGRLRRGAPPPPVAEVFAELAATPLVELALRAPADDGERETELELSGDGEQLAAAMRAFVGALDARWPHLDLYAESYPVELDFPGAPIPASIVASEESVEVRLVPNGDTRFFVVLYPRSDGCSLAFRTSAPHALEQEWAWTVATLEVGLRSAGLEIQPS